jgi:hypothetical protein
MIDSCGHSSFLPQAVAKTLVSKPRAALFSARPDVSKAQEPGGDAGRLRCRMPCWRRRFTGREEPSWALYLDVGVQGHLEQGLAYLVQTVRWTGLPTRRIVGRTVDYGNTTIRVVSASAPNARAASHVPSARGDQSAQRPRPTVEPLRPRDEDECCWFGAEVKFGLSDRCK